MCKKTYSRKPEMSVNRVLAEISSQFQGLVVSGAAAGTPTRGGSVSSNLDTGHSSYISSQDTGEFAQPGEVPCDACIGRKLKAHKSCVNCLGSFCETHLRHHKRVSSDFHICFFLDSHVMSAFDLIKFNGCIPPKTVFQVKTMGSHRLIEPTFHLEEKICKKHERLLDAYCRSDHTCICTACADAMHKSHDIVSVDHEFKKKTVSFGYLIHLCDRDGNLCHKTPQAGLTGLLPISVWLMKPMEPIWTKVLWRLEVNLLLLPLWASKGGYDKSLKITIWRSHHGLMV